MEWQSLSQSQLPRMHSEKEMTFKVKVIFLSPGINIMIGNWRTVVPGTGKSIFNSRPLVGSKKK